MADFSDYEPKRVDQFTELSTITDNDLVYIEKASNNRGYKAKAKNLMPDGAIGTDKIADGAVTAAKINNKAVTEAKLDDTLADKIDRALFIDNDGLFYALVDES